MSTQHESADTELDRMPTNNKKIFWEEISYKKGATELFLAIEEMEWRDAFDIIASDPGQAQTWVNNSGAGVFVNCWRRLPIHEVCKMYKQCFCWNSLVVIAVAFNVTYTYH